jgi:hypothetical protein
MIKKYLFASIIIAYSLFSNSYADEQQTVNIVIQEGSNKELSDSEFDAVYDQFDSTDIVIWSGMDYKKIDVKVLPRKSRLEFLAKGLLKLENSVINGSSIGANILSKYYFYNNEFRKALYYAEKGAELGSYRCMEVLRHCYANGKGVVQDYDEAVKWTILSKTLGSEDSKEILEGCEETISYKNGLKLAREWMKEHKSVFIGND